MNVPQLTVIPENDKGDELGRRILLRLAKGPATLDELVTELSYNHGQIALIARYLVGQVYQDGERQWKIVFDKGHYKRRETKIYLHSSHSRLPSYPRKL